MKKVDVPFCDLLSHSTHNQIHFRQISKYDQTRPEQHSIVSINQLLSVNPKRYLKNHRLLASNITPFAVYYITYIYVYLWPNYSFIEYIFLIKKKYNANDKLSNTNYLLIF